MASKSVNNTATAHLNKIVEWALILYKSMG